MGGARARAALRDSVHFEKLMLFVGLIAVLAFVVSLDESTRVTECNK